MKTKSSIFRWAVKWCEDWGWPNGRPNGMPKTTSTIYSQLDQRKSRSFFFSTPSFNSREWIAVWQEFCKHSRAKCTKRIHKVAMWWRKIAAVTTSDDTLIFGHLFCRILFNVGERPSQPKRASPKGTSKSIFIFHKSHLSPSHAIINNKYCHRCRLQCLPLLPRSTSDKEKKSKFYRRFSWMGPDVANGFKTRPKTVAFICILASRLMLSPVRSIYPIREAWTTLKCPSCERDLPLSRKIPSAKQETSIKYELDTLLRVQTHRCCSFAFASFRLWKCAHDHFFLGCRRHLWVCTVSFRRLPADCLLKEEKMMEYFRFIGCCVRGCSLLMLILSFIRRLIWNNYGNKDEIYLREKCDGGGESGWKQVCSQSQHSNDTRKSTQLHCVWAWQLAQKSFLELLRFLLFESSRKFGKFKPLKSSSPSSR